MAETLLVIPCYNEATRMEPDRFSKYLNAHPETGCVFVDDGSRDGTLSLLRRLADRHGGQIHLVEQTPNRGKAEAVRQGMLAGLARNPRFIGYFDADLATPLSEVSRLRDVLLQREEIEMVFGSRVQLMGRHIVRNPARHYVGRVFATLTSRILDLAIYDTQCGAKLFRTNSTIHTLFAEPFLSNWCFDVELIARRIRASREEALPDISKALYELPLDEWIEVQGSRVRLWHGLQAALELIRIKRHYLTGPRAPSTSQ